MRRLVVEILDSKGSSVNNARVTFRVRTGQGRLSQRGNGRAIAAATNTQGLASADYTPMSARSTVVASVKGVSETVTFTITDGWIGPRDNAWHRRYTPHPNDNSRCESQSGEPSADAMGRRR